MPQTSGMEFKVTALGTGSAMPVPSRVQSAHALSVHGRSFIIDCGEGAQKSMVCCGFNFSRLDAIFISHIHGDHVYGLPGLLATLGMGGRTAPLNIYGPTALGPILKFFLSYYGVGLSYEIQFTPITYLQPSNPDSSPVHVYSNRHLDVWALPLDHGLDTFGYLFREREPQLNVRKEWVVRYALTLTEIGTLKRGEDVVRDDVVIPVSEAAYRRFTPRSYAYMSDTSVFPKEKEWVRGVDLLYHEATFLKEHEDKAISRHHSTTVQAATLAKEAEVGRLLIGHYSSRCMDQAQYETECREVFPGTYALSDGDEYEIPLKETLE